MVGEVDYAVGVYGLPPAGQGLVDADAVPEYSVSSGSKCVRYYKNYVPF